MQLHKSIIHKKTRPRVRKKKYMKRLSPIKRARFAAVFLALWAFTACDKGNEYVAPLPPKVTVAKPLQQEVIDYLEFTGNTRHPPARASSTRSTCSGV